MSALAKTSERALAGGPRTIKVVCPMADGTDNEMAFVVPATKLHKKWTWLARSAVKALQKAGGANGPKVATEGATLWLQRATGEKIEQSAPVSCVCDGATVRVRWRNPNGCGDGKFLSVSKWDFSFVDALAPRNLADQLTHQIYPEPTRLHPDRKPTLTSPYDKSTYYYLERESHEKEYAGELTELEAFLWAKSKHVTYVSRVCQVDCEKKEKELYATSIDHKRLTKKLAKQTAEVDAFTKKIAEQKAEIELYRKTLTSARKEAKAINDRALARAPVKPDPGAEYGAAYLRRGRTLPLVRSSPFSGLSTARASVGLNWAGLCASPPSSHGCSQAVVVRLRC